MKRNNSVSALLISVVLLVSVMGTVLENKPFIQEANAIASINVIVSPQSQTVDFTVNQFAWYSVLLQSVDGFQGPVNLNASVQSGPSTKLALSFPGGSTVFVPTDGQVFSYVMATVGSPTDTPIGVYIIQVTARAVIGGISRSATAELNVIQHVPDPGDFRLSSDPGTLIDVVPGGSGGLRITVTGYRSIPDPILVSLLMASSIPSEIHAEFNPMLVNVHGYSTNTSDLTITTTTLTPAGNYTLVISGTADLLPGYTATNRVHTWAITVRVSGFYVAPMPMFKSVIRGKSTTFNIGVASVGTFSQDVLLSAPNVPTGMTSSFNPTKVQPPPGGVGSSILTITTASSMSQGTYYVTVVGSAGGRTSKQSIAISVGDFAVAVTPASKTAEQNSTATFTVTGTSSDDYTAVMSLGVSGVPTGVTPTFSPPSIVIPVAGSNTSTLNLAISQTAPVGTHILVINGTSGTQSHTTNATLIIVAAVDYSLTLVPSSQTVRNGSSTTFTININSINAFSSPVTLTVNLPSGSGATGSINPPAVTPPPNGMGTATLTITTAASAPAGSGTITVTGTSGSKSRTATGSLTISPTGGRPCIIATATYGSELAPEVYFLRLFRDRSVQSTFAGSQFMNVFNAWYYSFSPTVAEQVKNNLVLRNVAKAVIYPLLGTLYLAQWSYSALSFAPELGVFVAGLVASSLIGIVYFAPITALATELARRKRLNISVANKPFAIAWIASAALILSAELSALPGLMMVATAAFVLSTIALAVKATVTQTQRILH